MTNDNVITSPHRRTQATAFSQPASKKQSSSRPEGSESCSSLIQRHCFLLKALVLVAFLCTVYLYFAITLGSGDACAGLTGAHKESCKLQQAKRGKLKFF